MLLYHYTSLSALSSIFKDDEICLWATRYDKLNDPTELVFTKSWILPMLSEQYKMDVKEFANLYGVFPYILSLCEVSDSPHMWKKYADNGKGVVLALSYDVVLAESQRNHKNRAEDEEDFLFKERYCKSDECVSTFKNMYDDFHTRYGITNDIVVSKLQACAFIKGENYKDEREWRYARIRQSVLTASSDNQGGCIFENNEDKHGVQCRPRNNECIPYLTIRFQPCALKEIHYIPQLFPTGGIEFVQYLLNSVMYRDVAVILDNIDFQNS